MSPIEPTSVVQPERAITLTDYHNLHQDYLQLKARCESVLDANQRLVDRNRELEAELAKAKKSAT